MPWSRETTRSCCAGVGGGLRPFDLRRSGVGANEEARSSHRSANERLQLCRSLETRVKLYQSASPNKSLSQWLVFYSPVANF